ncbi:MAG: T9SS type A sorting domain-containing protein [Bacteroidales bacterium]|nr:T9SS type A sorting domain-containing protein [Bacteroidales bacterium]
MVETIDSSNVKLLSYIGMIPYLLEAIKAQQAQIEDLKEQLGDNNSSAELKSYSLFGQESTEIPASLSQNKPNPFSSETRIEMFVPQSVANATLYVYDLQGKQVKSISVIGRGATFETIHGSELQAGLYIYSLVTDCNLVGSKQMVLTE